MGAPTREAPIREGDRSARSGLRSARRLGKVRASLRAGGPGRRARRSEASAFAAGRLRRGGLRGAALLGRARPRARRARLARAGAGASSVLLRRRGRQRLERLLQADGVGIEVLALAHRRGGLPVLDVVAVATGVEVDGLAVLGVLANLPQRRRPAPPALGQGKELQRAREV